MKKRLINAGIKHAFGGCLLALLLAVNACGGGGGPASGGTGGGPVQVAPLNFTGGSGAVAGSGPDLVGGFIVSPALPACTSCSQADLRMDETGIELRVPCGQFIFRGNFDTTAAEIELQGQFQNSRGQTQPAVLRLSFPGTPNSSPQVIFTLLDSKRAVLLGPALLQKQPAASDAPAACKLSAHQ